MIYIMVIGRSGGLIEDVDAWFFLQQGGVQGRSRTPGYEALILVEREAQFDRLVYIYGFLSIYLGNMKLLELNSF